MKQTVNKAGKKGETATKEGDLRANKVCFTMGEEKMGAKH